MHRLSLSFFPGLSGPSMKVNFPSVTFDTMKGTMFLKQQPPILLLDIIFPVEISKGTKTIIRITIKRSIRN